MITLDEALEIRIQSRPAAGFAPGEVCDLGDCWWIGFAEPIVGSGGVVIDKTDGHAHWLGSAMGLETWMFAHRCGFRHRTYCWTITAVRNEDALRDLLSLLRYAHHSLDLSLVPLQLKFNWFGYEHLPRIAVASYIDYHFNVMQCEHPGCMHIGTQLPDFRALRKGDGYEASFRPALSEPETSPDDTG